MKKQERNERNLVRERAALLYILRGSGLTRLRPSPPSGSFQPGTHSSSTLAGSPQLSPPSTAISSASTTFHCLRPASSIFCHLLLLPRAFRYLARPWPVTVSPSSLSNSVETTTSHALPHGHRVGVPDCGGTSGRRCRWREAR